MSGGDFDDLSMFELFAEEATAQIATLAEGLVALESTADKQPVLDELMRAAHSLKGGARILGLEALVKLAHALEDIFVAALRDQLALGGAAVDALLGATDLISAGLAAGEAGMAGLDALAAPTLSLLATLRAGALVDAAASTPAAVDRADAVAPAPASPASIAPPPAEASAAPGRAADKSIRMTADAVGRLTSLAAEAVVEATRLESLLDDFSSLRERQGELYKTLTELNTLLERGAGPAALHAGLAGGFASLAQSNALLAERHARLEQYARRSSSLAQRLARETLASRMLPFASILRGYPRLVRDLTRELGKNGRLELRGESTQIDREVLDRLDAPLGHLLRNALDHGLESPAERTACGKPAEGRLLLEAYHRAGKLRVVLSDDGRGIDPERLRAAVVARGLEPAERAAALSASELYEFLFLPGFSTATALTEISGRGVGLDAVRAMVQDAHGTVRIRSTPGSGTSFDIELPVTRSVVRVLRVSIADEAYAIPIAGIERVLSVDAGALRTIEGRPYFGFESVDIALVPACEVLALAPPDWQPGVLRVVVIRDGERTYGLMVDAFAGECDLVVRPIDPRLGELRDVAALATDEAGGVVLILDVEELVRNVDGLIGGGRLQRLPGGEVDAPATARKRILVVDDSLTVRQAARQLLENQGYAVDVAVDGLEAWSALRLHPYELVVTDVDMPRLNGIELVRKIRGEKRFIDLPVVVVSYKDRGEDRQRGLEAGANYYLSKGGFRDTALLEAVLDLIGPARE